VKQTPLEGGVGPPSGLEASLRLALHIMRLVGQHAITERRALSKAQDLARAIQAGVIRIGFKMSIETLRRLNLIDAYLRWLHVPLESLTIDQSNCLRLFAYWAHLGGSEEKPILPFLRASRNILGPAGSLPLERYFGTILARKPTPPSHSMSYQELLSLRWCVPVWYVVHLARWFGWKQTEDILRGHWQKPVTHVWLNTLKAEEYDMRHWVEAEGIHLSPTPLPSVFRVTGRRPIQRTEAYKRGLVQIQDMASVAVAQVANPSPDSRVLEIGAAPGGKTACLSELMGNRGAIYSVDVSSRRMRTWLRFRERLGFSIAEPIVANGTHELPFATPVENVVIDAPCSNTGVLHKAPSLKWRLRPEDFRRYARIQSEILDSASSWVSPGGYLTYATCSIMPEENELVIEEFIRKQPDFHLAETGLAVGMAGMRGLSKARRLFTHLHGCNGAFIAKLARAA